VPRRSRRDLTVVASTTARPLRGLELLEPLVADAALARYQRGDRADGRRRRAELERRLGALR
jgi:hypothetical protein